MPILPVHPCTGLVSGWKPVSDASGFEAIYCLVMTPEATTPVLESADITCPYCWETITIDIDTSNGSGDYVEDCQVCCNPIRIAIGVDNEARVTSVEADRENS
ncbi:MAG: CPXCG motif-containing cysteine-rich protein [Gammaproteobacteria bacterium]